MFADKILNLSAIAVICLLVLTAGCGPSGQQTADLRLKFTPQDSTVYKVTTLDEDSIEHKGTLAQSDDFKDSKNSEKVEMTFAQQIQSTDDKGNAVAKITIKELKYSAIYVGNPILDFDSSSVEDQNKPMAKLIGQSYTIKLDPTGKVTEVIDAEQARAAARGGQKANKAALKLVTPDAIKARHTVPALPTDDKAKLLAGQNYSNIKTFDFRMLGANSYEKIYTLEEIKDADAKQIAVIKMNAIPTSQTAEEVHKKQQTGPFAKMFDNTQTYTGQLKLDLTAGKIENYCEKLSSQWIAIDPAAEPQDDKEPDSVQMTAVRSYSLEKID